MLSPVYLSFGDIHSININVLTFIKSSTVEPHYNKDRGARILDGWLSSNPLTKISAKKAWSNAYNNWRPIMTARRTRYAYFSQQIWINHGFEDSQPSRIRAYEITLLCHVSCYIRVKKTKKCKELRPAIQQTLCIKRSSGPRNFVISDILLYQLSLDNTKQWELINWDQRN